MITKKIVIDEYETGSVCKLYSIWIDNNKNCEFENFLDSVDLGGNKIKLDKLLSVIERILNNNGALERYFRRESKEANRILALPTLDKNNLRLYCIRISDEILIIGNGGVKTTDTYQEDPILDNHVRLLEEIDKGLKSLERKDAIDYLSKSILDYPLEFTIKL